MLTTATLWWLLIAGSSPADYKVVHERGRASLYRPWRKSATVPYARYAGAWSRLPKPSDAVCAHRWIPFGTILRLTRKNGLSTYCVVLDRGPFGACAPTQSEHESAQCPRGYRYVVQTRKGALPPGSYYRSVIDATPLVHDGMRSPGWIWVRVERLVRARPSQRKNRQGFALND